LKTNKIMKANPIPIPVNISVLFIIWSCPVLFKNILLYHKTSKVGLCTVYKKPFNNY
jgi:hypothetical protein